MATKPDKTDTHLPTDAGERAPAPSERDDVAAFVAMMRQAPRNTAPGTRGRLIFAMDATASRAPTWDRACHIQSEMFTETAALGGLEIQLVFYRGYGECKHGTWASDSATLLRQMGRVACIGGRTQIEKVLRHAVSETRRQKVNALVFVGDCMEEDADTLCHLAGELGVLGVPAFLFHEGGDPTAAFTFRQIARLTGGAYCRFDEGSARQLRDLLSAVAVFAAGGLKALADYGARHGGAALQLTHQMPGSRGG